MCEDIHLTIKKMLPLWLELYIILYKFLVDYSCQSPLNSWYWPLSETGLYTTFPTALIQSDSPYVPLIGFAGSDE